MTVPIKVAKGETYACLYMLLKIESIDTKLLGRKKAKIIHDANLETRFYQVVICSLNVKQLDDFANELHGSSIDIRNIERYFVLA